MLLSPLLSKEHFEHGLMLPLITSPEESPSMTNENNVAQPEKQVLVNAISLETFVCLALLVGSFVIIGNTMGVANMFGTAIATAYDLLIGTVFFIMALAVVAGGAASFMAEFGVVALINKIISPLMRPLYNLPGAAVLGIIVTFLSDNPAIVALGKERNFIKYFKIFNDFYNVILCLF